MRQILSDFITVVPVFGKIVFFDNLTQLVGGYFIEGLEEEEITKSTFCFHLEGTLTANRT